MGLKLEELYTKIPEKELCSERWEEFYTLQTNVIENKNLEIENLLSIYYPMFKIIL